jgi:hypothetical protein
MKYLFIFSLVWSFSNCFSQGIYDYSIITPDSSSHSISEFQGKKIMIVVLPSARTSEDFILPGKIGFHCCCQCGFTFNYSCAFL